jgi:hypothetical protein
MHGLDDVVCTVGCSVQATLGLAGENGPLDQMLRRKSSGTSGAVLLSCRNWDGLRSPISSVGN